MVYTHVGAAPPRHRSPKKAGERQAPQACWVTQSHVVRSQHHARKRRSTLVLRTNTQTLSGLPATQVLHAQKVVRLGLV